MQPKKFRSVSSDNLKIAIIDGNALLHRAYHAYPQTLRTSRGDLVNAVYGFSRLIFTLVRHLSPAYMVLTFDTSAPTFRHLEYAGYKAQRPVMKDELAAQLGLLKDLVKAMGVKAYAVPGFEADDIIGTLVKKIDEQKASLNKYIVTGDMDTFQLIDDNTFVYSPTKGLSRPRIWQRKDVVAKYGFGPESVVDYKALRGDPSDNIPGVSGVGDKTAKMLIKRWGSVENIYKNIDRVSPRSVAEKLAREAEVAALSKNLALIRKDVPLRFKLSSCSFEGFGSNQKLAQFFKRLEFNSLLKRVYREDGASQKENQLPLRL